MFSLQRAALPPVVSGCYRLDGNPQGRRCYPGLTLGVFLRLGEKDPTSAAAEPATVLRGAAAPFIPDIHHSQTSNWTPSRPSAILGPGRGRGIGAQGGGGGPEGGQRGAIHRDSGEAGE